MIDNKLIRDLRQRRNLTLQELAQRAGLSVSYLSEVERGKKQPSLETIEKLSTALNISKEGLISQDTKNPVSLGDKVALLRQKLGLSLSDLAEKVGISSSYLCQIENNSALPSLSTLKNIACALEVKTEDLMDISSNVGYKLKKIRQERNLTQAKLAEQAGVSTGMIGQVESGKVEPSIKTLEKIAAALSLSPCFFVTDDDDLSSLLKPMNPEVRELLSDAKVRSTLELIADCTAEEFSFIVKFIQLYKEHRSN